ncbi:hypothetical protein FGG78_06285 [Thioclava sp. BHET1]|uniref:PepSY domain-containing protein n=1 Tax=Thioclava dalianensis TaxID=1185766 RepID=A0A074TR85_9RHOB|nr:PepSY domain-containing protein [Thioclava dalianensis]KEP71483.1 hypothetical protein DL1_00180 [Thioclava dalianensis]TMV92891.1 hypothetical protein FGG78_06285 [Thioclava sp. BHET1]SFN63895.1 Peptidase propeptide and YPEB domain-containing protein [Thioclava dalianensis]
MKNVTALASAALIAAICAQPVLAEGKEGKVAPAKEKMLTTQLTKKGYDVRRMEMEGGLIEVYAVKNGKRMQMYFNTALKQVEHKADKG